MIYLELFLSFLKIGLFTIGGGYAMLPLIADTVITKGWLSSEVFIDFIAVAESTPGPFAVNLATFVGTNVGGIPGSIAAVFGLFVPSFVIIYVISYFAERFLKNKYVKDAFVAMRATVVALIINAFVTVAVAAFFKESKIAVDTVNWFGIVWFAVCFFVLRFFKKIHPIFIIILSAGVGILFYGFIL